MTLDFKTNFRMDENRRIKLNKNLWRITDTNSSPYTFKGTNTFLIINKNSCLIYDTGSDDENHINNVKSLINDLKLKVEGILISHRHIDHLQSADYFKSFYNCPIIASSFSTEQIPDNYSSETFIANFKEDLSPLEKKGKALLTSFDIEAVSTPGHTPDHICIINNSDNYILTGDHIMAWSTSVIIPPFGNMGQYLNSLNLIHDAIKNHELYPAHGGSVIKPQRYIKALIHHRQMRENSIENLINNETPNSELSNSETSNSESSLKIADIRHKLYPMLDKSLHNAAEATIKAHLINLQEKGNINATKALQLDD